ncbi:MAG: glycosyltransferase involved in cell wall biosynthesis [Paraglaciecola sp.]|jgi:glycosyltransferase involved in cell wall biosynthesis
MSENFMEKPSRKSLLVSLIAPMYNEEEVIGVFFSTIESTLKNVDVDYEIVCVNDGSNDTTIAVLKAHAKRDERIKIVDLSRNYGKELALTAGLDYARGDAVIPIDCDLQDPPEVILKMIEKWQEGYQVVLAKRIDRTSDSRIKRWTSTLFYKLIDKISDIHIPANVGDFRLLDKVVLEAVKTYRERSRFMKGLFASLGFKEITIEYVRAPRAAGETKWNYWNLYKLAIEGIISFTSLPLKIWSYIGATVAIGGFVYGIYLIIKTMVFGVDSPGYASLMVVLLFMSGLILLCLGVIGEYLSRIFIEIKARPLYIVMETVGFETGDNES